MSEYIFRSASLIFILLKSINRIKTIYYMVSDHNITVRIMYIQMGGFILNTTVHAEKFQVAHRLFKLTMKGYYLRIHRYGKNFIQEVPC